MTRRKSPPKNSARKGRILIAPTLTFRSPGKWSSMTRNKLTIASPSRIAFSDFKGYEDWAVVSSARTD